VAPGHQGGSTGRRLGPRRRNGRDPVNEQRRFGMLRCLESSEKRCLSGKEGPSQP
jgi:hypothetical protein